MQVACFLGLDIYELIRSDVGAVEFKRGERLQREGEQGEEHVELPERGRASVEGLLQKHARES